MDGNNRWSKKKSLSKFNAYKKGAENLIKLSHFLFNNTEAKFISAFALSKNNLDRSSSVLNIIKKVLKNSLKQFNENELNFKDLKNFLSLEVTKPLILILDNIIDPRNLGACIRSAAVIGVDALIINKHHCAPINAIAHKVSVGGAEVIKIFHVTNLINCLKFLKRSNVNIYGLSEHAKESHLECNFTNPSAIIMGAEESGIREKTLESCDFKINLSNNKLFKSFNVSVATGIILSEANRQRQIK